MRKLTQKKGTKEDPKQTKISNFFTSPTNGKKLTKAVVSIKSSASSSSKSTYEIDLTEDDEIKFPLTPPKSQNTILSSETGKTVSNNSPSKKKKNDKENSVEDIEEIVKEKALILSPEVIPPTPPQSLLPTSKSGNKGVKRKFEFSASKNCEANSGSNVHVKKISKTDCNVKVESDRSAVLTKDGDALSRLKEKRDPKDCQNEKEDIAKEIDDCKNNDAKEDESLCKNEKVETECNISNCDMENLLFEDWELDNTENIKDDLKLDKAVRCIITKVNYSQSSHKTEVHLKELKSSAETKCTLEGSWSGLILREKDTISIAAKWDCDCGWIVSDLHGFVVLEPDTLISSTALVGSLFCMRRAILASMFRGLDPESEVMVIGSLVHEILQEVLDRKVRSEDEIKTIANEFISTRNFIFSMYSSQITMEHVKKQLDLFVPRIKKFISTYISPVGARNNDDWHGEISAIEDIEENIWATNLGLKGKVDVTVKVKVDNTTKILPLELKTGRASMSAEHRGQVILYALMMTEIGQPVSSGLLLYLREGVMKEVKAGVMEKRDLILLRNELLRYTFDRKAVSEDENGFFPSPRLPQPINHRTACNKCPYVTICSSALKESGLDKLSSEHPMNAIAFEATSHLKSEHIRFTFHWVALLQLEEAESSRTNYSVKDIWTLPPEQREANKNGVAYLKLVEPVLKESGRYNHLLRRDKELSELIALNDYLVVSTDKRVSIASGFVRNISSCEFTISLERDLSSHKDSYFFVDHYQSNMQLDFNLTNLGYLLERTSQSDFLRNMIISMELPTYNKLSSQVLAMSQDLLAKLNKCQKHAVLQALATQHYLLIKGMPGTGKTETLVSLVELLVRLGQSVLVTSHTHSAVDNILRRLPSTIDILRLGSISKVHPDVKQFSEQNLVYSTPEELESKFNRKRVVGVTCLGSAHVLLRRRTFNVVVVDEATQVLLPTTLRPLFAATRFILVGDPQQLPPLVRSQRASDQGLNQSLFSHLDRPAVTAVLSVQYRMNQCITDLANGLTYKGELECANDNVKNATIELKNQLDFPTWMTLPLSERLEQSVVILDSGYVSTATFSNEREAAFILNLVTTMKDAGIDESQIGVIAPYQDQVSLIRSKMAVLDVEVSTVDTFQGRDKNIIIYSCTRSSHAKESGLLSNHNRLTVAITRAKQKLIFIGDLQTLKGYSIFQKLFSLIDPSNVVVLPDEVPS